MSRRTYRHEWCRSPAGSSGYAIKNNSLLFPPPRIYAIYAIMFVTGIGLSTHYVVPWAIIPDTVDYDYSMSGVRREGAYYGLWMFMIKIGQTLAGLFVGMILGLFGYVPDVVQSGTSLPGIRLLVGPITSVFFILGIVFLYLYPIDRKRYEEIRETIKNMEGDR